MTRRFRALAWIGGGIAVAGIVALIVYLGSDGSGVGAGVSDGSASPDGVVATPDIAQRVLDEINAFRSDPDAGEMDLTASELTSFLRYSAPDVLPEGVTPPEVRFSENRIILETRVAVGAFPPLPDVERALDVLLPDSVSAQMTGTVIPFGTNDAAIRAQAIRIAGVPLPGRLIPRILDVLGRVDQPGLPPDAMMVPLPEGLSSAYILSDRLMLVAEQ